jgi:mannitol-specific phosphotransferase system IIBC component
MEDISIHAALVSMASDALITKFVTTVMLYGPICAAAPVSLIVIVASDARGSLLEVVVAAQSGQYVDVVTGLEIVVMTTV